MSSSSQQKIVAERCLTTAKDNQMTTATQHPLFLLYIPLVTFIRDDMLASLSFEDLSIFFGPLNIHFAVCWNKGNLPSS